MQTIEYNMLALIQGSYNNFSVFALWGGFIAIKRASFLDVGGFSLNAITEDMDLSFKLNEKGWRVEQSFHPVYTHVPDSLKAWIRQRIRWGSGGCHCLIKYYRVWLRNPLHILFIFSFCALLVFSTFNISRNILLLDDMIAYFDILNQTKGIWLSMQLTTVKFGFQILAKLFNGISFTFFSLPFVFPLVSTMRQIYICFMVVPFSFFYIPTLSIISIFSGFHFFRKRRILQTGIRAW